MSDCPWSNRGNCNIGSDYSPLRKTNPMPPSSIGKRVFAFLKSYILAISEACSDRGRLHSFLIFAHFMKGWKRSEEHTSELQSLMRSSYAVFCLKQKKQVTYTYLKY